MRSELGWRGVVDQQQKVSRTKPMMAFDRGLFLTQLAEYAQLVQVGLALEEEKTEEVPAENRLDERYTAEESSSVVETEPVELLP
jgi:hypothetical protein